MGFSYSVNGDDRAFYRGGSVSVFSPLFKWEFADGQNLNSPLGIFTDAFCRENFHWISYG